MYSLLLVDDEAVVRLGVKSCLDWDALKIGRIYEASNGVEALSILDANPVDIMITDIKMAAMDGLTLMNRLMDRKRRPEVLVMSCYNDFDNMREAMKCGARDFLFKPSMYPEDIFESVKRAIEHIERASSGGQSELHFVKHRYLDGLWWLLERLEGDPPPQQPEASRLAFGYINQLFLLDDDDQSNLHRFATLLFSHAGQLRGCASPAEIAQLLRKLMLRASVASDDQVHGSIARSMEVIDQHLSDPNLSLDYVAAQIGLSPSYFSRLFKSATRQNYTDYIVEKRIALADELRGSTNLKAGEIASRVGYANLRYFSKLYKRHTGHSIGRRET